MVKIYQLGGIRSVVLTDTIAIEVNEYGSTSAQIRPDVEDGSLYIQNQPQATVRVYTKISDKTIYDQLKAMSTEAYEVCVSTETFSYAPGRIKVIEHQVDRGKLKGEYPVTVEIRWRSLIGSFPLPPPKFDLDPEPINNYARSCISLEPPLETRAGSSISFEPPLESRAGEPIIYEPPLETRAGAGVVYV